MAPRLLAALSILSVLACASCATGPAADASRASPGWERVATRPGVDTGRALQAGFLIVDGVYNSELVAPYDIFQHTIFHTEPDPGIEVFTVSLDGGPVTTFEGLVVETHYAFGEHPPIDILVVPSAEGSMDRDLENETMMRWVRETGARASYVVSLCDGAFVLAAAGLLDGRVATTFPGDQDRFAEMFPEIDLRREPSFVHDGPAVTSQGGARSYDPAMYLVDHLYGEEVARGVGRGLIIDWPPDPASMPAVVVSRP